MADVQAHLQVLLTFHPLRSRVSISPDVCVFSQSFFFRRHPIWWTGCCQRLRRGTMFPCHVSAWPAAEPVASCGNHAPAPQPSQSFPDLLHSCPAPPLSGHSETPSSDTMESLIVVTECEPRRPFGAPGGEEEVGCNTRNILHVWKSTVGSQKWKAHCIMQFWIRPVMCLVDIKSLQSSSNARFKK